MDKEQIERILLGEGDGERRQRKKQAAILAAGGILIPLLLLWGDGSTEISAGEVQLKENPTPVAESSEPCTKILGAELTGKQKELRDPFSVLHQTRKEYEKEQQVPPETVHPPVDEKSPPGDTRQRVEKPPVRKEKEAQDAPFRIQGIVRGKEGNLAILEHGGKSRSLKEGEELDGERIATVGDDYVLMEDGTRLQLQMP